MINLSDLPFEAGFNSGIYSVTLMACDMAALAEVLMSLCNKYSIEECTIGVIISAEMEKETGEQIENFLRGNVPNRFLSKKVTVELTEEQVITAAWIYQRHVLPLKNLNKKQSPGAK